MIMNVPEEKYKSQRKVGFKIIINKTISTTEYVYTILLLTYHSILQQ